MRKYFYLAIMVLAAVLPPTAVAQSSQNEGRAWSRELYREAVRQRLAGHMDASIDLCRAALEVDSAYAAAAFELGTSLVGMASRLDTATHAEGIRLIERAVALEPDNASYLFDLGTSLFAHGDTDKALEYLEAYYHLRPTQSNLELLVHYYELAGDMEHALEGLVRLEELDTGNTDYSLERIKVLVATNRPEEAENVLMTLLEEDTTDVRYIVLLSEFFLEYGRIDESRAMLQKAIDEAPEDRFVKQLQLKFYRRTNEDSLYEHTFSSIVFDPLTPNGDRSNLMKDYSAYVLSRGDSVATLRLDSLWQRVLELEQDDVSLVEVYIAYLTSTKAPEGRATLLIDALKRYLAIDPTKSDIRYLLISSLADAERYDELAEQAHAGRMLSPYEELFYYDEAIALRMSGREEEAYAVAEEGLQHFTPDGANSEVRSMLYQIQGDYLFLSGRHKESYAAFNQAIALSPGNLLALNNYAYFLSLACDSLDRAESLSRRTIEAEPENATYLDTYAWILYQQKRYGEAKTYIDKTILHLDDEESSVVTFDHAGDIYFRSAEREAAVDFWKRALEAAQNSADEDDQALVPVLERKIKKQKIVK